MKGLTPRVRSIEWSFYHLALLVQSSSKQSRAPKCPYQAPFLYTTYSLRARSINTDFCLVADPDSKTGFRCTPVAASPSGLGRTFSCPNTVACVRARHTFAINKSSILLPDPDRKGSIFGHWPTHYSSFPQPMYPTTTATLQIAITDLQLQIKFLLEEIGIWFALFCRLGSGEPDSVLCWLNRKYNSLAERARTLAR